LYLCRVDKEHADCPAQMQGHGLCSDCEDKELTAKCKAKDCPYSEVSTWKSYMRQCKSCENYLCRPDDKKAYRTKCRAKKHMLCGACEKKQHRLHQASFEVERQQRFAAKEKRKEKQLPAPAAKEKHGFDVELRAIEEDHREIEAEQNRRALAKVTCEKGHELSPRTTPFAGDVPDEEYYCDMCDSDPSRKEPLPQGTMMYSCLQGCSFDACARCFESPTKFVSGDVVTIKPNVEYLDASYKVVAVTRSPRDPPVFEVTSTKREDYREFYKKTGDQLILRFARPCYNRGDK